MERQPPREKNGEAWAFFRERGLAAILPEIPHGVTPRCPFDLISDACQRSLAMAVVDGNSFAVRAYPALHFLTLYGANESLQKCEKTDIMRTAAQLCSGLTAEEERALSDIVDEDKKFFYNEAIDVILPRRRRGRSEEETSQRA